MQAVFEAENSVEWKKKREQREQREEQRGFVSRGSGTFIVVCALLLPQLGCLCQHLPCYTRDDARLLLTALHCVRFACTCVSIGKYCRVVPTEDWVKHGRNLIVENLILTCVGVISPIKAWMEHSEDEFSQLASEKKPQEWPAQIWARILPITKHFVTSSQFNCRGFWRCWDTTLLRFFPNKWPNPYYDFDLGWRFTLLRGCSAQWHSVILIPRTVWSVVNLKRDNEGMISCRWKERLRFD